jgi:hypothetical protein
MPHFSFLDTEALCTTTYLLFSNTESGVIGYVGEYGVHWNFFFTLAAVSILTSIVRIHPKHCGLVGLLTLAGTDFSNLLRWTLHCYNTFLKDFSLFLVQDTRFGYLLD